MGEIQDAISENIQGPKSVRQDDTAVTQHSLKEQVAGAQYIDQQQAAAMPARGLRFTKMVMPESTA